MLDQKTALGFWSDEERGAARASLRETANQLVRWGVDGPGELCPADRRIQAFLSAHLADVTGGRAIKLPGATLVLSRHGLARELSLPEDGDHFSNDLLQSYRVRNGVLHNPRSDRRTTEGTFHIAEGGLPIPGDKRAVPKAVYAKLFEHAMNPPADMMTVPFTVGRAKPLRAFASLLLRPLVCPEVPGYCPAQTMEVRFIAPASLVSNLDFVESIFGNAGDPYLQQNDAALDITGWTGHTGCVILAPHLTTLTKKELGLPSYEKASERQRHDGMCFKDESEKYNNGVAFKVTCRTIDGVVVTLIADNYFGYCKKEVKTQVSFAANLRGNVEEEHSGGALAFRSYSLGPNVNALDHAVNERTLEDVARDDAGCMALQPGGYGIDRRYPNIIYIPGDARASVERLEVFWTHHGKEVAIPLVPGRHYVTPSGYKMRLEKHATAKSWQMIGTAAEGVSCHKPCTVSGGGKSEISKSLRDYMLYGPIFVADVKKDFDLVQKIFDKDHSTRWKPGMAPDYSKRSSRSVLSTERSLGSVIKLLTPSDEYTDEYNAWLGSIPNYIYPIVFIIKRFVPPDAQDRWRDLFGVDSINGMPGQELKGRGRKLVGTYLRVGLLSSQAWRTFKLRQDFAAAAKVQTQDDITASIVVPASSLKKLPDGLAGQSVKFIVNCESRLFQRPDDAVHRGLDKQTELDMSGQANFLSNFEPITSGQARAMAQRVTEFEDFTPPMQKLLRGAADTGTGYVVCSANPRIVDGKPSKNPRYLQDRPDLVDPLPKYLAMRGARLARGLAADEPLYQPVNAVLIGRRSNPPDYKAGIRPLAVYGPIHYQELPELFMDFICSLTGKSPSTTGAGSEGALTKSPFNMLRPIVDLNNALVSYMLTGLGGFSTAAGYVGPDMRVDHDISLLIPEIWCRLSPIERDPAFLIREGHLEAIKDFDHKGTRVLASRLGYRVTAKFVRAYFGRIFDNPARVFDEAFLRPETQGLDIFVDGVKNITEAQQRVAQQYFDDGSIQDACPPLRALLSIMAQGQFEGKDAHHPEIRALFDAPSLLKSTWYLRRLDSKKQADQRLWQRRVREIKDRLDHAGADSPASLRSMLQVKLDEATRQLRLIDDAKYLASLTGTLGVDPSLTV